MKTIAKWSVAGALLLGLSGVAYGQDTSGLREELADLRSKVAAMETARMAPAATGDAEALTSMKKKGAVKIGGDVTVNILVSRREEREGAIDASVPLYRGNDDINNTEFRTWDADLNFKVQAAADAYLYMKLDLDDDATMLEECYFMFSNVMGSPLGIKLGKAEVPFGQDKGVGILYSYHHNGANSLLAGREEADDPVSNPHASVGNFGHPQEVDNRFQITGIWTWPLLTVEASIFQNATGMHEDRPDDNLAAQSYALRLSSSPLEGLKLSASFMNQHFNSMGDHDIRMADGSLPGRARDAEEDQQAISLAADYTFKSVPLTLFGEWAHGFDYNYDEDYASNTYQLGGVYGINESLDVYLVGEWLDIDADNNNALFGIDEDEDWVKVQFGVKYLLDSGIHLKLEYIHEWYDNNRPGDDVREADGIAFETGWSF